jgi:magnesium chelatase family protein
MLATIHAATLFGVLGRPVVVEVHVGAGVPGYTIVGLPDTACREARDRARAAILSCKLEFPNRRITVNLAPTDLPKSGSGIDLALAVGMLAAGGQVTAPPSNVAMLGELGLDGSIRRVPGILPMAAALPSEVDTLVVASEAADEAALRPDLNVVPVGHLSEVVGALRAEQPWPVHLRSNSGALESTAECDLRDVRGQPFARLALEVAAAGGHHLLLSGPPGAGKTMLAERLGGLLPDLSPATALEVTSIASAVGQDVRGLVVRPPFRAPHHSISPVAMIGGGSGRLRPGEISRAHGGVLFCDELGEFPPSVLDALRQPLESGLIRISRANCTATLPARFQLIAATNPCPCGAADRDRCCCSDAQLARYARRISGPILDRFDLRVHVGAVGPEDLLGTDPGECSGVVAERVARVRSRAAERGQLNATLSSAELAELIEPDVGARRLVEQALATGQLSGRGLTRVRRLALTLDDRRGGDGRIDATVMAQALALRGGHDRATPRASA